jgi:hypothetical protein
MSKARELAELGAVYNDGALSNRNMVYNGAFEIAQRGTSFSVTTSYTDYTLDRWRFYNVNGGAHTATQSTTVPNNSFKNSFKLDCTTADTSLGAGDYNIFAQLFEGQDLIRAGYGTSSAKKMTLSFWVRSNKTGTYYAELQLQSGGQASVPYTINAADTWEHKTCTFNGKTDSAPVYDTSVEMYLYFWLAAGSGFSSGTNSSGVWQTNAANRVPGQVNFADSTSNEWYVTGVQLELGDAATPYEYRSSGQELARCQRYYYQIKQYENAGQYTFTTGAIGGTNTHCMVTNPQQMRAAPSTSYSGSVNIIENATTLNTPSGFASYTGTKYSRIEWAKGSLTAGNAAWVDIDDATITFNSEL